MDEEKINQDAELPKIKKSRKAQKLPDVITEAELIKILQVLKNDKDRLAVALGFYECLRVSEIVNLKPDDINKETKLIHVRLGKGSKDRMIPIAPEVLKGLKHLPIGVGDRALQYMFKKAAIKVLNRPDIHFHTLRHCLSEDAKILTKEGWKDHKELRKGEDVYTYSIENDRIELKKVINVHRYDFDGELNHIKNKYVDCLFTDEHRFVFKRRKEKTGGKRETEWGEWELLEWNKMPTQFKIKLSAKKDGGDSIGIHRAGILGWILSDGQIRTQKQRDKKPSGGYSILISQSLSANKEKSTAIEDSLIKAEIPYTKTIEKVKINNFSRKPYQMVIFTLLKGGNHSSNPEMMGKNHKWIFEYINEDRTPKWKIFELKVEELEEIQRTMMLGDGSNHREYCNQNIKRIEFFQTLSHLIGKKVFIGKGVLNMGKNKGQKKYRTYLFDRDDCQIDKHHITKEYYKGAVWCPETENGTIIVKRKGKIFITGNSGITHYITKKKWSSLEVQRLAGHSRIATTQIYTHIRPDDLVSRMWE